MFGAVLDKGLDIQGVKFQFCKKCSLRLIVSDKSYPIAQYFQTRSLHVQQTVVQ